jgi:hypothetical protein
MGRGVATTTTAQVASRCFCPIDRHIIVDSKMTKSITCCSLIKDLILCASKFPEAVLITVNNQKDVGAARVGLIFKKIRLLEATK